MRVAVLCQIHGPILPVMGQHWLLQEGGWEAELGQAVAATGHPLRDGGGGSHHPVLLVVAFFALFRAGSKPSAALFHFGSMSQEDF